MGGPCLAHKPWLENQLRQVGTGSSVFPLIKRRGGADAFLHEQWLGGRWGLLTAPCCSASPEELRATGLMKSRVISVQNTLFSHHLGPLGAALICSLVFSSFHGSQRKCLSVVPVLGDFWRCHVVPSCCSILYRMAWRGPTFSWGKAFPRPPAKSFLPLCKTIIISINWTGLGLNLQRLLGFGKSSATAKQIMLNKRLP